ncbi:hypothetical protein EMMF5_002457 [Cystobasidiomycetes sp. EMM_F5]
MTQLPKAVLARIALVQPLSMENVLTRLWSWDAEIRCLLADLGLTNTLTLQEKIPNYLLPAGSSHPSDAPRNSLAHKFRIAIGSELPYYGTNRNRDNIAKQILLACIDGSIKSKYPSHTVQADRARNVFYATNSVWLGERIELLVKMSSDAQDVYCAQEAREAADLLARAHCDTTSTSWQNADELVIRTIMKNLSARPANMSAEDWKRYTESGARLCMAKRYDIVKPVYAFFMTHNVDAFV